MTAESIAPHRLKAADDFAPADDVADAADAHARPQPPSRATPSGAPAPSSRAPAHDQDQAQGQSADRHETLRILEALLFAASEPLDEATLARHLKTGSDTRTLIEDLQRMYAGRGVNLVRVAGKWAFRTADDLSYLLERHAKEERKLSKAAMETMAIIAYHQPVTRAEIEEIRGVATSGGTLDVLMETGWIRPRGRRRAPGRPITYGTTTQFLEHFGMDAIKDLPGLAELKGAGLLDSALPPDFTVPEPTDVAALMPDEVPLDALEEAHQASLPLDDADEDHDDRDEAAGRTS